MAGEQWVRRVVGGWAAMTLCFGVAAVASDDTPDPEVVRVASEGDGDDDGSTATTALRPRSATTTPPLITTSTSAPEAPTTTAPAAPADPTPATTEPVPETTTTTVPPQPTFSMSKHEIVVSQMPVEYIWTAGTGCTGPGHVDDEYGIVGTVYYADGTPWSSGDRVLSEPGTGDWISNMWMANPGSYWHGYACTLLDGTVVFEYARQQFTVIP